MNYPKMLPEIVDSVHYQLEDYPEVETDCMLFLLNGLKDECNKVSILNWFDEHGRCPNCGEPLAIHHYREPHYELDPVEYEEMNIPYCPNCDIGEVM